MPVNVKDLMSGLKNKNDDVKLKTASDFKNFVVNDLKDRSHDDILCFIDGLFFEFTQMMTTNEYSDKKAVLIAINCIADVDVIFSHNKFSELSKQITNMSLTTDLQINALKSRFLAQLNMILTTADKIESQIKESYSTVVDDTKSDVHKIYAAITLKDSALYASTIFFQHASRVISSLLIGIRDKQANVREACAVALSAALSVTSTRESIHNSSGTGVGSPKTSAGSSNGNNDIDEAPRHLKTSISIMRDQLSQQPPANYNRSSNDDGRFTNSTASVMSSSTLVGSQTNASNLPTADTGITNNLSMQGTNVAGGGGGGTNTAGVSVAAVGTTSASSNSNWFGDWNDTHYFECINNILRMPDDNTSSHISNRNLPIDAWNHGTLLLLNEMLKLSNNDLEINRLKVEEMMGMSFDQLCVATWSSSSNQQMKSVIMTVRNACNMNWPMSNTEEHIFNHRAKTFHSNWCQEFIQKSLEKIWTLVLQIYDSSTKHPQYIQLLLLIVIPRMVGQNPANPDEHIFTQKYTHKTLDFLWKLIKKDRELKPLVFITYGLVIHVAAEAFQKSEHLERITDLLKNALPNKDLSSKKRQPILEMSVYLLIGLLATGCRGKVSGYLKDMIQPMVDAGLSLPLIYSLKMISCFIRELTGDIHSTLLKCLRQTLMYHPKATIAPDTYATNLAVGLTGMGEMFSPQISASLLAPLAPTQLPPDQLDARNKILALRTLMQFEFDKQSLSLFVRFISSRLIGFMNCPFRELRIEAVRTCAQLLTSLLGNDSSIEHSDRNTLNAVAEVLQKLLLVSTSDPDPDVRLCVFQSMEDRFDPYLAQQCHLGPLFISLNDEKFEIRRLVIRCLGKLSAINPSCLKPGLRKVLHQLLHELEVSDSSIAREHATKLLAELIDTAPGFIQPHAEQLLMLLLPRIASIVEAAYQYNSSGSRKDVASLAMRPDKVHFAMTSTGREIFNPRLSEPNTDASLLIGSSYPLSNQMITSPVYSETSTVVQLAILEAVKNLAVVAGTKLRSFLDDLIPALILLMQDGAVLQKRQAAVATLSRLLTHTGYVVLPYKKYPKLLPLLLLMLRTEEVGSIRREIIKLLGTIGALDPFKLRTLQDSAFMVDERKRCIGANKLIWLNIDPSKQPGNNANQGILNELKDNGTAHGQVADTGYVVSMHEVVEKKEVDMSQAELLVNVVWGSMDEFYTACSLQALIQLIRDPAYRPYFDRICASVMLIFKSLGTRSVQYLRQILPEYFRCIVEAPDSRQQEILLGQLCMITDVVKLHLKQFMPELIQILEQLWNKRQTSLTKMCILVLKRLNRALGADMKEFLTPLVPLFQHTLTLEAEQSVIKMLELFPEFGYAIEESITTLLPTIIKIISRDDGGARLEVKKCALDCMTRIVEQLDLASMAGRIVHPVCRMLTGCKAGMVTSSPSVLITSSTSSTTPNTMTSTINNSVIPLTVDQLDSLVPPSFDLLTTLLVKMRRQFLVLAPLVQKTIDLVKVHFPSNSRSSKSILWYNTILNKVMKETDYISYKDDDLYKYESVATKRHNQISRGQDDSSSFIFLNNSSELQSPNLAASNTLDSISASNLGGGGDGSVVRTNTNPGSNVMSDELSSTQNSSMCSTNNPNSTISTIHILQPPKTKAAEDWLAWLRRVSVSLLRQSPSSSLRACAQLEGCSAVLCRNLFNAAFVSCWPELSDEAQDSLVNSLEFVLLQCASTEVSQAVLNLEEFMSRCDRMKLPIPTSALASRALKNRVYAKALYYKEQEFIEEKAKRGVVPQPLLFDLLSINHKLQLEEAAIGVVNYATKMYKDKLQWNEELWRERLQEWNRALNLYERKLEEAESRPRHSMGLSTSVSTSIQSQSTTTGVSSIPVCTSDLVLGRMRCLHALGDWTALRQIGIERFNQASTLIASSHSNNVNVKALEEDKIRLTHMIVSSAWALGDFKTMSHYVEYIPMPNSYSATDNSGSGSNRGSSSRPSAPHGIITGTRGGFDGCFLRAVVFVQQEKFPEAHQLIQQARDELDTCLTAMAGESYIRAYADLVEAQKLAELEEVIQYKLVREGRETIRQAWSERLLGCQESLEDWRQLLQIRGLVLRPLEDLGREWVRFAGLARRQGRLELCKSVVEGLTQAGKSVSVITPRIQEQLVRVKLANAKYLWSTGQQKDALSELESLLSDRTQELLMKQSSNLTKANQTSLYGDGMVMDYVDTPEQKEMRNFYAKCNLRLGQWLPESSTSHMSLPGVSAATQPREIHDRVIRAYRMATDEAPWLPRVWQTWAMANYALMCQLKARIVDINTEMNNVARSWYKMWSEKECYPFDYPTVSNLASPNQTPSINTTPISSPNLINNPTNHNEAQLPHEIQRMTQPLLRFTMLQQHQQIKRSANGAGNGNNCSSTPASMSVAFPSPVPVQQDTVTTFGQAASVIKSDVSHSAHSAHQFQLQQQQHPDYSTDSSIESLADRYFKLNAEKTRLCQERDALSPAAVRGLVNAVALAPTHQLPQEGAGVRLVIVLFRSGRLPKVRETVREGITRVRLESWIPLLHQLFARLDTAAARDEPTAAIVTGLLASIGEKHPQAVLGPLTLAFKSGGSDRRRHHANKVLHSLESHSASLVSEAFLLNEELIRLAISWVEMWAEALEDASKLYYEEKNVKGMFKILHPLHLLTERCVETQQEEMFLNEYAQDLDTAKNFCIRYESSSYKTDLTQAWDIYSTLYRKWNKQISNFSTIELSVASPRLHEYRDWKLAIPGSYEPVTSSGSMSAKNIIRISSFRNCLTMMSSKQHPRKLALVGSDGHNYTFLLKGHEDIRQDERAMQFFGLINSLLAADPNTVRRNLSIQRMSIIPLSTNTGLIGWVPNSDTLNVLIREYREKAGLILNIEHKEMMGIAPEFEKLNIIQKTEVFEAGMRNSKGSDLADLLWQKSHNSEAWFERRTNFIRSLAVMSMVGYILGLGDRHPSNIMLCRQSGKVIHIDFGDCFEVATLREKYPEKVPFRLSRMLIRGMEVTGISGLFRHTCVELVKLMRRHSDSLMAVLEAFIHDPLLQWVITENNANSVHNNADTHGGGFHYNHAPTGTASYYQFNGPDQQQVIAIQKIRQYLQLAPLPSAMNMTQPKTPTPHNQQNNAAGTSTNPATNNDTTNNRQLASSSTQFQYTNNNNNLNMPSALNPLNISTAGNSNTASGGTGFATRIFTDPNYPDSNSVRNPYSINQWRHHLCNGPWLGKYETSFKMRKRLPDESIIVERDGLIGLIFSAKPTSTTRTDHTTGSSSFNNNNAAEESLEDYYFDEEEWAGANIRAMKIMRQIQNKLEGREQGSSSCNGTTSLCAQGDMTSSYFPSNSSMMTGNSGGVGVNCSKICSENNGTIVLTPEQHVKVLIDQATSNYNLSQMFFGWCAFW